MVVVVPYTILLNTSPMAMLVGARPGDDFSSVASGQIDVDYGDSLAIRRACQTLFARYNNDSGSTEPGYRSRSLSVGDVVTIGDKAYEVTQDGWRTRNLDDFYEYSLWMVLAR